MLLVTLKSIYWRLYISHHADSNTWYILSKPIYKAKGMLINIFPRSGLINDNFSIEMRKSYIYLNQNPYPVNLFKFI